MRTVFICSPYRGDIEKNENIARLYCQHALSLGLAPFAPHLLYPQMLDDNNPQEREYGINAGLEFLARCDEVWSVEHEGVSEGMRRELDHARALGKPIRVF